MYPNSLLCKEKMKEKFGKLWCCWYLQQDKMMLCSFDFQERQNQNATCWIKVRHFRADFVSFVLILSTWNTVRQDWVNVSKWLLASTASVNLPPKICIPKREKIKINRNRITSKEFIDEMELTRDFTKLPIDAQYLKQCANSSNTLSSNYFVNKELSSETRLKFSNFKNQSIF